MNARILSDASDTDMANRLETAILAATREDLLRRSTDNAIHDQQKTAYLDQAIVIAYQLAKAEASGEEAKLIKEVEELFARFRTITTSEPPAPYEQISLTTGQLLQAAKFSKPGGRNRWLKPWPIAPCLTALLTVGLTL
jgi:hypothetical protein